MPFQQISKLVLLKLAYCKCKACRGNLQTNEAQIQCQLLYHVSQLNAFGGKITHCSRYLQPHQITYS